jgi:uncharacterized protein
VSVSITLLRALAIGASGFAAGTLNGLVGSGTLLSFPVLLGVGFEAVPANITNTIGLTPGSFSAASAQRRELTGQGQRIKRLAPFSVAGAALGAGLLLALPSKVFANVVPFLVLLGVALVILQPRSQARLRAKRAALASTGTISPDARETHSMLMRLGVFATGVYGGYFGAGQGVILMGVLGSTVDDELPRLNGTKNVLAGCANATASLFFIVRSVGFGKSIPWAAAGIIAASSILGGQVGARAARRIPANVLRALIVVVGTAVAAKMLLGK